MIKKLEDSLVQLSSAIEKSDRLEREAGALRAEVRLKDDKISQVSHEMSQIRESNAALYKSKELLQRAMLEQVSDVRSRLDQAGMQNKELEATIYKQRETERGLKDMIRSTNNSPLVPQGVPSASMAPPPPQPAPSVAPATQHHLAFPSPLAPNTAGLAGDPASETPGGHGGGLEFPSLEQLAGIDKDVISKLLTPQSAMRLRHTKTARF